MEYLAGFIIALAVGLTGVGAGSVTAPVLMLFFGLPPAEAVGTALAFGAVIKLAVAPFYIARNQVSGRVLSLLCLGGIPGVLVGVLAIGALDIRRYENILFFLLGSTIVVMAVFSLYRSWRPVARPGGKKRLRWLPLIAGGIGAEVGFSSAGAGALGSLTLLNLTSLSPAQVIGTDMMFGLVLSLLGGGIHLTLGHFSSAILWRLIAGGLAGAFAGANLSAILPSRPLRVGLSLWLSALGLQLCWKALF
jgi:uncharacterized membrane protein YfcA